MLERVVTLDIFGAAFKEKVRLVVQNFVTVLCWSIVGGKMALCFSVFQKQPRKVCESSNMKTV